MSYNTDFYNAYESYLLEPKVREAHDWIFSLISPHKFFNVVDLGCGYSHEFYSYVRPRYYFGVDETLDEDEITETFSYALKKCDYRKQTKWDGIPAFVSLFSLEITAPYTENYKYYNELFIQNESMKSGLVSGFFYNSKRNHNPIEETGGIKSWQTLENIGEVKSDIFSERRIILPVPSKMFGDDVYEVWKIFERV